jgi:hypothetical protein
MAAHRLNTALAAIAVAVLTAGCATAVGGTPLAGTTLPPPSSSQPVTSAPSSTTTSASAPLTSVPSTVASSIRPMPPLDTTEASSSGGVASSTASSGSGPVSGTVAGIDLDSVLTDLESTNVAAVESDVDLNKLAAAVDNARAHGLELAVLSIGSSISDDDTSAISDSLFASLGGTVLVLSPSLVSARSEQLTSAQRDDAIKAAADGKNDLQAVTRFIDSALNADGAITSTPPTTTSTKATVGKVGGIDVDGILAALGPDHIAISKGVTDVTPKELKSPVTKAWNNHLKVYVGILGKDATGHLYDVASAVMHRTQGTVILISPSVYAISSVDVSDKQLDAALDAGADATSYVELVTEMVNSLLK